MVREMTRKQQRNYFKNLRKNIYKEEYDKARVQMMKAKRKTRIDEIRGKAQRDAKKDSMGTIERMKHGAARTQRGLQKIQQKRVELGGKVQPYLTNLNNQFDLSNMGSQKQKKKPPYNPFY